MKKILIIQTAFIGDVILATPLVEALHRAFPEARIDFLLRKGSEGLFKDHPFLNEVLIWDKRKNKYKNLLELLRKIRATKYDLVINCQRFAGSGFLAAFSGAKSISGFNKNPFSAFFNTRVKHEIGNGQHETERNLKLIAHLRISGDKRPKIYPQAIKIETKKPYVCLAPASVWFTKQWPEYKWVELIREFHENISVYLIGGPEDKMLCDKIIKESSRENTENMCGKLNLLESAALMRDAEMNYVNDSAPMHLCSAVNAPVTAIFCSTVPAFGFGPLSDKMHIVEMEEQLDCRPCGLHGYEACPKGHFKCAQTIAVNRVI